MGKRKQEISVLNVLFCLFVIMIHILSYPVGVYGPSNPATNNIVLHDLVMIPQRLISFVVQGFVLLSGVKLFLKGRENTGYFKHIAKRIVSIVVPYLICNAVYYIYYINVYRYPLDMGFILEHLIYGSLVYHLYFIPLILQFDLLLPLWRFVVNKWSPVIVIPAVLFGSSVFEYSMPALVQVFTKEPVTLMNDRLFTTYLSFWLIGCYIGKYYKEFCELVKKNYGLISLNFVLSAAALAFYSHFAYNWLAAIPVMNQIQYFYAISAIIFLFATARKMPEDLFYRLPLLPTVDKLSYSIYLWHVLVLIAVDRFVIEKYTVLNQGLAFVIRLVSVYTVTILLTYLMAKIKQLIIKPFKKDKPADSQGSLIKKETSER